MKFGDFSDGLTYEDVQVGLDPSAGSGLVTLDSDCNGVFKISDKATQVLKVVQSDGTHTLTQTFDLSGLTLAPIPTENMISPNMATFDLNPNGAKHENLVFTVTPATDGAKISKLYMMTGDAPDPTVDFAPDKVIGDTDIWSVDTSELVLTMYPEAFHSSEAGTTFRGYVLLDDDSTAQLAISIEDTT